MRNTTVKPPKPIPSWVIYDESDHDLLSKFSWSMHHGYAVTNIRNESGRRQLSMHRLLMEPIPPGIEVDHINRIRHDNRRSNLRFVTYQEQAQNRSVRKDSPSGLRGVCWNKRDKSWYAISSLNGKRTHVGCFKTMEQAQEAVTLWRKQHMPKYVS